MDKWRKLLPFGQARLWPVERVGKRANLIKACVDQLKSGKRIAQCSGNIHDVA